MRVNHRLARTLPKPWRRVADHIIISHYYYYYYFSSIWVCSLGIPFEPKRIITPLVAYSAVWWCKLSRGVGRIVSWKFMRTDNGILSPLMWHALKPRALESMNTHTHKNGAPIVSTAPPATTRVDVRAPLEDCVLLPE